MESNNDAALLKRLQEGDIGAYEELFKRYYRPLSLQAFYLLKDEMEAEDIVQTLFIDIWDRKTYRQINSTLNGYLQATIHNRCLNLIAQKKNQQRKITAYFGSMESDTQIDLLEQTESAKKVSMVIDKLPMQRMQAFNLVYMEGKKYKEAALEMGITINSVKTHLKLAVKVLRQRFINYK